MPEETNPHIESPQPRPDGNAARRLGRRVLDSIFPGLRRRRAANHEEKPSPAEVDEELAPWLEPEEIPTPLGEVRERTVIVTRVDHVGTLEFTGEDGQMLYPPVTLPSSTAPVQRNRYNRLARMYVSAGIGEHSFEGVAVMRDAKWMAAALPREIFNHERTATSGLRLWFGNMALASRQPNKLDEAELDKDKVDLTTADHAIITNPGHRYYIPFDSNESILAARVVEALRHFDREDVETEEIARVAWRNMTIAERRLFLQDLSYAFADTEQVQDEVLEILRGLTHQLLLTLEPHGEKFTVRGQGLRIEFHDRPIKVGDYPEARPVLPPGHEILIGLSPEHLDKASAIVQIARESRHLEDEEAIWILDFITSTRGRRAINEVFEPSEGMRSPAEAIKALHALLKLNLGEGYMAALRNRTISGNKMTGGRRARQVGGRLPGSTKWHIGRPFDEMFKK